MTRYYTYYRNGQNRTLEEHTFEYAYTQRKNQRNCVQFDKIHMFLCTIWIKTLRKHFRIFCQKQELCKLRMSGCASSKKCDNNSVVKKYHLAYSRWRHSYAPEVLVPSTTVVVLMIIGLWPSKGPRSRHQSSRGSGLVRRSDTMFLVLRCFIAIWS